MGFVESVSVENAAWREAAWARDERIEGVHLLLGLLALGGSAAACLGGLGVSLADARRARVEGSRAGQGAGQGTGDGGADGGGRAALQPRTTRELGRDKVGELAWAPEVTALVKRHTGGSQVRLAAELLREDAPAAALVRACGVEPATAIEALGTWSGNEPEPHRGTFPPPAGVEGEPLPGVELDFFVSAARDVVARVATDAEWARHWLPFEREAAADGTATVLGQNAAGRDVEIRRVGGADLPAVWRHWSQGKPNGWLAVTAEPAPGGCRVTFVQTSAISGLVARLTRPAWQRFAVMALRTVAQDFAFSCAGAMGDGDPGD